MTTLRSVDIPTPKKLAKIREKEGLTPATYNYSNPTIEMIHDPIWNAIWDEIKTWDINVPYEYIGYMGATGSHATAIYKAIVDISIRNGIQLD
jgi:hypothetical protein